MNSEHAVKLGLGLTSARATSASAFLASAAFRSSSVGDVPGEGTSKKFPHMVQREALAKLGLGSAKISLRYRLNCFVLAPRGAPSDKQCSLLGIRTSLRHLKVTTIVLCLTRLLFK